MIASVFAREGARVDYPATLPTARLRGDRVMTGRAALRLMGGAAAARDLSRSQNFFSDSSFEKRRRAEYPAIKS
jgi:hypothetical protein